MAQCTLTLEFARPDWLHMFDYSRLSPVQMLGFERLCARDELAIVAIGEAANGRSLVQLKPSPALVALVPELAHFGVVEMAGGVAA